MRYVRPDSTSVWVHNSVSPLVDLQGMAHRVLTVTLEIGERKRAEEQTSLLLGELDHRVKNILSIISSVITQTLKTSSTPGAFAAAMEGRIAAIARAHSLLTEGGRGTASLRDLIVTELAPYDRQNKNISTTGPTVALTPRAGLVLAMAIHELAGNAAKYGALSTSGGRLAVNWQLDDACSASWRSCPASAASVRWSISRSIIACNRETGVMGAAVGQRCLVATDGSTNGRSSTRKERKNSPTRSPWPTTRQWSWPACGRNGNPPKADKY
jgi:two-component sensor histidine kinase